MKITVATKRRIERLELNLAVGRPIALWPKMLSISDWEAIALPMQNTLSYESNQDQANSKK